MTVDIEEIPTDRDVIVYNEMTGWYRTRRDPAAAADMQLPLPRWDGFEGPFFPAITDWREVSDHDAIREIQHAWDMRGVTPEEIRRVDGYRVSPRFQGSAIAGGDVAVIRREAVELVEFTQDDLGRIWGSYKGVKIKVF